MKLIAKQKSCAEGLKKASHAQLLLLKKENDRTVSRVLY